MQHPPSILRSVPANKKNRQFAAPWAKAGRHLGPNNTKALVAERSVAKAFVFLAPTPSQTGAGLGAGNRQDPP
jgi:hypothetical protein